MNTKSTCRLVKYFEFCEYKKYMSSGKIFFYECIASMFHCGVNEVKLQQIRGVGMITPSFTKYSSFLECRLVGRIMHACAFLNQSLYDSQKQRDRSVSHTVSHFDCHQNTKRDRKDSHS